MIECMNTCGPNWDTLTQKVLKMSKQSFVEGIAFVLPNFNKVFHIDQDAIGEATNTILSQDG